MDQKNKNLPFLAIAAATALFLAGCAMPTDEPLEECEPGVSEISEIGTAVPTPNC